MTAEEAKAAGYEVVAASPFEVGLLNNGRGLKTWWAREFDCKMPTLDHPLIQEAINVFETYAKDNRSDQ